jgi:TetR/AcrR family transcriptional repressor of nem operon
MSPRTKGFDEEAVLKQAMELFWKKGFHATSVQDIVDHLGISRASLYGTFGGKKELFYRAFEHYRQGTSERVRESLKNESSVKTGLRRLFEMVLRDACSDSDHKGCFVVNASTEMIPGDERIEEMVKANKAEFESVIREMLHEGQRQGEIPEGKDPEAIANLLFTLHNGFQVVSKYQRDPQKHMASVDAALALLEE